MQFWSDEAQMVLSQESEVGVTNCGQAIVPKLQSLSSMLALEDKLVLCLEAEEPLVVAESATESRSLRFEIT